jgi:hypothetical protein
LLRGLAASLRRTMQHRLSGTSAKPRGLHALARSSQRFSINSTKALS